MAQEQAVTALVFDASKAVSGAKDFEAAAEKVKNSNKSAAAASDVLSAASDRLQKAQDAVSRAAERVQKAQEAAAKAAEKFGAQSEQASKAAERVAQATESASRAQDRLSKAQDAAVSATERMVTGLANQERRLAAIEAKYAPAIAAENRLAQTKEYLNGVIERGGPQMERAQRLLASLTEQEKAAAAAAEQQGKAMANGATATVRAAQAQEAAAASGRKFNATIGQVGFQVQDFANQVAYGGNVASAAGMQLGQLLGSLGPMGAAVGAVVNVGGILAGVLSNAGNEAELTSTSFTNYTKSLEFAKRASEEMKGASEGMRAALEAEGRAAVDAAQKRLTKAEAELKSLETGMLGTTDAASAAGIAISYLWNSGRVKELRQEIEVLRGTLGKYNDGAREVRLSTEQNSGTLKAARDSVEDYRESLRQQIDQTKLLADNEDLSNAGKLRARLETEALSRAQAAGRTELDAGTKALIENLVKQQERIDTMEEDEKASKKAATAAETLEKTRKKVTDELDRDVEAQKRLAEIAGMSASKQAEANTQTRIAAELAKAHTTASTEEGRAIAAKVKEAEKWKRVAADEKMIKGADEQLAYAKQELSLMGQTANVRERALKSIQIQRDAIREWGDTTSDAAKKWIALQEQIADAEAIKSYREEVNRVAEDIAKDWSETLYDAIVLKDKQASIVDAFRDLFKRIAIEAIKANIVLPITQQIVGAVPSLFGIQAGGSAANQNGGGLLSNGNLLSLGSKFLPTGGISSAIDTFGATYLGIGTASQMPTTVLTGANGMLTGGGATSIVPGEVAAGTGLSGLLGAAGAGALGGMAAGYLGTATNSKAVGGLSGAALGAGASYLGGSLLGISAMTGPIGLGIAAAVGLITGLLGTQKATVGPTASSGINRSADGKSVTSGGYLTDNGGDINAAKQLGDTIALTVNAALLGGGSLTRDLGIGRTEKKGLYVSGSLPYKEFGDDVAGMYRYALLESGTLKDGGANTVKAIQNSKAKDFEEAAKDIGLGASIDAGSTALKEMVKTLSGVTDAAKKATTESFAPMFEELSRAKKLGIGDAYVGLATDQLKAYLDQLRNPPDYTEVQTAVATMTGQFQAARDAYAQLNPAMVTYVDQIEKETKAKIAANFNKSLDQQIAEASGRGYVNQINGLMDTLKANAKSLAAVGEPATKAQDLYNTSLTSLLKTLTTDQLGDVAKTFGGDIATLATTIQQASAATTAAAAAQEQATRFEGLIGKIRQENAQSELSALNEQKSAANSLLSSWKNLQSSIGQARQSLLVGDLSTLDPKAKMDAALSAYRDALGKAQGGDVDASGQVSGLAQTALQAARAYYASNQDYARIFSEVTGGLEGVESVASRQVSLASQQVSKLDAQIAIQQDTLKALQVVPADIAAIIKGINSGNSGDILTWSKTQDSGTQAQIKKAVLDSFTNADIEAKFGGFSDIQAARAADPSFNLAAWFQAYGKSEVLAGTRKIPGFATGTDYAPGGLAWVGEKGPELMQLPGGARIYPASDSMAIARSWGAANDRWGGGNVVEYRPRASAQSSGGTSDPEAKALMREMCSKLDTLIRVSMGAGDKNIEGLREVADGVSAVVKKVAGSDRR